MPKANGVKIKRSRIPEGMIVIRFMLSDEEHEQLSALAQADDREPDHYARLIVRKALGSVGKGAVAKPKATKLPSKGKTKSKEDEHNEGGDDPDAQPEEQERRARNF